MTNPHGSSNESSTARRELVVVAVDGVDRRPVDGSRSELLRLEVSRNEDGRVQPFGGRPGRDRAGEVAGRRARERRQPELLRLPRGHGDHPVLEGVRRVRGVEFEPQLPTPTSSASRGAGTSGVMPGASRGTVGRRHRQKVGVPPERGRAGREPLAGHRRTHAVPVVDRVERPEALPTGTDRLERVLGRAHPTGKGEG